MSLTVRDIGHPSNHSEQLPLFQTSTSPEKGDSNFSDPSFVSNKSQPIHRWVPWIAGFSSEFVKGALDKYLSPRGGTILDPFAGVGTTLVDAILSGHNVVGFEINPYAAMACRLKVNASQMPVEKLENEMLRFRKFMDAKMPNGYAAKSTSPGGFKSRTAFYSPKVLQKVLIFHDFIRTIKDGLLQEVFKLAFASTMVSYSNYSYEPSLCRRISAGRKEIHDFPVELTILQKLQQMTNDIKWAKERAVLPQREAVIINDTFFRCDSHLAPESADLIVTSPPYLNNYHYNRNTRPQLYWLGLVNDLKDMKDLEESNFGKYWQTVRDLDRIDLNFLPSGTDITEQLKQLRMLHPERGCYGGRGWANYATVYFNDCHKFAIMINYILKPGGTALVVIGNSILQGILIPTDQYFGKIAESVGLELVRIDIPRNTRVGNSIIKSNVRRVKAQPSHQLYEAVVELRKKQAAFV